MKNELNKIDKIYKEIGEIGSYQIIVIVLISFSAVVLSNGDYNYSVFLGATPDFRCKIPILENDTYEKMNEKHSELIDLYLIKKDSATLRITHDSCNIRVFNSSYLDQLNSSSNLSSFNVSNFLNKTNFQTKKCTKFVYSKLYFEETTTSHWNLVCDRVSIKSLFTTLFFVGGLVGIFPSGILADRYGRKRTSFIYLIACSLCYILQSILLNIEMNHEIQIFLFGTLRLLNGLVSTFFPIITVHVMELVGPSKRVLASNTVYFFFVTGQYYMLIFAYLIRRYNYLIICNTVFVTVFVFYFWFMPESPRWLMANKKHKDAFKIFSKIAKSNKKEANSLTNLLTISENSISESSSSTQEDNDKQIDFIEVDEKVTIKQFIRYFTKRKLDSIRAFAISFNWIANYLIYYGISLNTGDLAGNPYHNFAISTSLEIIAGISSQYIFNKFGRKYPCLIGMLISGIALFIIGFIPLNNLNVITVLALIAKFSISFPFNGMMIITSEVYPTVIRNTMASFCTTVSQLGSIIAPQIYLLGEMYYYSIPYITFGAFGLIASIMIFFLIPETKGKSLPDSLDEYID